MNPEDIRRISRSDPQTIERVITVLGAQVAQLEARVKELERQLKQNSQNSSKPPS
ncbi:DUF6444 domain-containing protein [Paenibacillus sp. S150]|uniref:DUF6444 domain-containing protein n=1 Tax=Paenibacillus sp. S150 TaxID=2749826 RepID=UPI001C55B139|nr:DUF6444 domain-containing protein [Paenibacillus sp. S150]MBW4080688.1 hypothetical protein [Paenibacillus sp. S150]